MTVEELLGQLGAEAVEQRVTALLWAEAEGARCAPSLASVLRHEQANLLAKVWAMMAIARLGPGVLGDVRGALVGCLADASPTVRRSSIQVLASLKDATAREAIGGLLGDHTLDPSAWFENDSTVAQAARAALRLLDAAGLVIRDYQPADAQALMQLFHRTVHTVCTADYTPAQLAAWSPESGQRLERWSRRFAVKRPFVADGEQGPMGFLELEPDGHIDGLYVHRDFQRQRVGTRLLQHAITHARRWGLHRIHAEVSLTALPFFQRHGFQLVRHQEVQRHGQRLRNSVMELHLEARPG